MVEMQPNHCPKSDIIGLWTQCWWRNVYVPVNVVVARVTDESRKQAIILKIYNDDQEYSIPLKKQAYLPVEVMS